MIPKEIPLKNETLFELALRHRSASPSSVLDSYERLEFFGDSVLGLVVAEYLFAEHPDWDQGMLSKAKSSVVQEGPLAIAAARLNLGPRIELSASEENMSGRTRPSILADIFEAVIGAIYLESGLERARWFILEQLHEPIMRVSQGDVNPDDYKSKLQEVAQSTWRCTPQYRVIGEFGNAHDRRFKVQVLILDEVMAEGEGRSKKDAEQSAAMGALDLIESHNRRTVIPESETYQF